MCYGKYTPDPRRSRAYRASLGPRHDECGLRYRPGEYTVNGDGSITLREIGTIRPPGLPPPALIPRSAVVILYQDGGGWAAEIESAKESQS